MACLVLLPPGSCMGCYPIEVVEPGAAWGPCWSASSLFLPVAQTHRLDNLLAARTPGQAQDRVGVPHSPAEDILFAGLEGLFDPVVIRGPPCRQAGLVSVLICPSRPSGLLFPAPRPCRFSSVVQEMPGTHCRRTPVLWDSSLDHSCPLGRQNSLVWSVVYTEAAAEGGVRTEGI